MAKPVTIIGAESAANPNTVIAAPATAVAMLDERELANGYMGSI